MKRKGKKLSGAPCGPLVFRGGVLEAEGLLDGRPEDALLTLCAVLHTWCWFERVERITEGNRLDVSITEYA